MDIYEKIHKIHLVNDIENEILKIYIQHLMIEHMNIDNLDFLIQKV